MSPGDWTRDRNQRGKERLTLHGQAKLWPTPAAQDTERSPEAHLRMKAGMPGGPRTEPTSLAVMAKLWPTPESSDGTGGRMSAQVGGTRPSGAKRAVTLATSATRLWPTPTSAEGGRGMDPADRDRPNGKSLGAESTTWATPAARDRKGRAIPNRDGGMSLPDQAQAYGPRPPGTGPAGSRPGAPVCLNPPFCEWLMGWPIGWTDCTSSATESYRSWLVSHSGHLLTALGSTSGRPREPAAGT